MTLAPPFKLPRARLSDGEVLRFRRVVASIVAVAWGVAVLGVVGGIGAAGFREQLQGAFEALLFPGFHAAALLWWLALAPLGVPFPTRASSPWVMPVYSGFAALIAAVFWVGLVPWMLTALRVYLWPHRLSPTSEPTGRTPAQ